MPVPLTRYLFCLIVAGLCFAIGLRAAESEGEVETRKQQEDKLTPLPKPFDKVFYDKAVIEHTDWFRIKEVEFGRVGFGSKEAIIWTLETTRPITCRQIELLMSQVREVHFHEWLRSVREGQGEYLREVHGTLLHVDDRIDKGSSSSVILRSNDLFRVWIFMEPDEVGRVVGNNASRLTFKPWKR